MTVLGWRTVPTNNSMLGDTAKSCEPYMRQVFVGRNPALPDAMAFERKLYVIRKRIGFAGLLLTDDIDMEALAGPVPERGMKALAAGCDMVLLCNDPAGQALLLESLKETPLANPQRVERMRKKGGRDLRKSVAYRESQEVLQKLA